MVERVIRIRIAFLCRVCSARGYFNYIYIYMSTFVVILYTPVGGVGTKKRNEIWNARINSLRPKAKERLYSAD